MSSHAISPYSCSGSHLVCHPVQKAAMASMLRACGSLNNRDIAPFVPVLVSCLAKPSEVPDCVHKLAATTFVQVCGFIFNRTPLCYTVF